MMKDATQMQIEYKKTSFEILQLYHVVGVLCCAASDIEIKGQVSHFEMHFRDFSSFSNQCYICKMDHIKEL